MFQELQHSVVDLLHRMVVQKVDVPSEYMYYKIPCPWLLVKSFQYLLLYPASGRADTDSKLSDTMTKIFESTCLEPDPKTGKAQPEGRKNAYYSILLETISLVVAYGNPNPNPNPKLNLNLEPISNPNANPNPNPNATNRFCRKTRSS